MTYCYVKNLQGDIVAILDANGAVVVSYVYDAWGSPISCFGTMANTLGKLNPFRYRGYVYDEETGLYYLRSRYYVPGACRFLNIDSQMSDERKIGKSGLYVFCSDNPIVMVDPNGTSDTPSMDENDPRFQLAMFMLSSFECRYEETFDDYSWDFLGLAEVKVSHTVGTARTLGNTREDGLFLVGGFNHHTGQKGNWISGVVAYGGQMDAILGVTITGTSLSLEVGCMDRSATITVGYTAKGIFSTFDISAEYTMYREDGSYAKSTVTFSVNALVAVLAVAAAAVVTLCPISWGAVAPALPAIGAMIPQGI